ncbi:hypothetical protein, partial [Streptomyces sp. NPDC088270]|uniref:hypothetical protein n=1 Tax=Streptomyces sp. NPDC088270 TaxID=3160990 RepID=UPI00342ACB0E
SAGGALSHAWLRAPPAELGADRSARAAHSEGGAEVFVAQVGVQVPLPLELAGVRSGGSSWQWRRTN